MEKRKVELATGGQILAEEKIQRGIFLRNSLSALLIDTGMMSLGYILRKYAGGYKFTKPQEMIKGLMYKDEIKIFAKNEIERETSKQTAKI